MKSWGVNIQQKDLKVPSKEHMEKLKVLFEEHGFKQVKIGG